MSARLPVHFSCGQRGGGGEGEKWDRGGEEGRVAELGGVARGGEVGWEWREGRGRMSKEKGCKWGRLFRIQGGGGKNEFGKLIIEG